MLDDEMLLNDRSRFELRVRDSIANGLSRCLHQEYSKEDEMEVPSTLRKMGRTAGKKILELGSGTGRFTSLLANECKSLLAIDFSLNSLRVASKRISSNGNVGLVRADISNMKLKPNSFDLSLSTLYSNLPTPEIRESSTKLVSSALKSKGKYILSAHHYELRMKLKSMPVSGSYENSIFYHRFTRCSLKRELDKYFSDIRFSTICIWIPYLSRIKFTRIFLSRLSERIPFLNRFGALILATATKA
ncbi:MAG: class I SAM-dependent methyltransferase [Nitrospirota bacterium]